MPTLQSLSEVGTGSGSGSGSGTGSGRGRGCRPGSGQRSFRLPGRGGRGTAAELRQYLRQRDGDAAAGEEAEAVGEEVGAAEAGAAGEDAPMDASPEDAAPGDAEDDWSHDFLSAEELVVIAQRIADRADARHAERQAALAVAAAVVESAYPAAEQAVAADELARLAGMNRRLGQLQGGRTAHNTIEVNRRRAEAVAAEAVAAADEVARLSAGAEDAANAHAEDAAMEEHLELQREEYRISPIQKASCWAGSCTGSSTGCSTG